MCLIKDPFIDLFVASKLLYYIDSIQHFVTSLHS